MKHNAKPHWLLAALLATSLPLQAAVTAEEAAKLKSTLTPVGAEKAGNKAGTIPAWDGGLSKAPAGYRNGDARPDPFAADKPLLSISAKNMAEHADKLTDGVQALMKKHPDFRIDVYPTRRSAAAPQFVYDNTFQNATRAKTVDGGHGVEGAYGGIPFPIPKDGYEAIWNHRLAWRGGNYTMPVRVWVMTADGKRSMASGGVQTISQTYYDKNGSLDKDDNPLKNAPHTALELVGEWTHAYSREQAVYPVASLIEAKYWPPVGRVDNVFGDRNLICACPSIEAYQDA